MSPTPKPYPSGLDLFQPEVLPVLVLGLAYGPDTPHPTKACAHAHFRTQQVRPDVYFKPRWEKELGGWDTEIMVSRGPRSTRRSSLASLV